MVSVSLCITGTYSIKSPLSLIEQITSLVTLGHSLTPSSVFEFLDAALTWLALCGQEVLGDSCVQRWRAGSRKESVGMYLRDGLKKYLDKHCNNNQEEAERNSFLSIQELNNVRNWRKRVLLGPCKFQGRRHAHSLQNIQGWLKKRMLFCYLGNSVTNIGSFVYSLTYKHIKTTLSAQEVIKVFLLTTFYSFKKPHKPPNSKLFSLGSN